jgi:hypothetical protein
MTTSPSRERAFLLGGLLFVGVGVLSNEFVVARLFSRDGHLETSTRIEVLVFQALLILLGWACIWYRKRPLLEIARSYPSFVACVFGLLVCGILWGTAEGICYWLNHRRKSDLEAPRLQPFALKVPDPALGFKLNPNKQYHKLVKRGGKVVYDVTYQIDEFSRRKTPVTNPAGREKFLIFLGCSFTFGEGVQENETIPYYAGELAKGYMPYNYGCPGYSPQQLLARLEAGGMPKEIPQRKGTGIYTFIDHHIERAIGSMAVYDLWGQTLPYYYLDHGELRRDGNFTTGRPVISYAYRRLGQSQIVKYFGMNFPPRIAERHTALTGAIIKRMASQFQKEFPGSDFRVVFYPGSRHVGDIAPELRQAGIEVLDYSVLFDRAKPEYHILGDQYPGSEHPSAYANKVFAGALAKDLRISIASED